MSTDITAILGNWTLADAHAREAVFAQLHVALSSIAARQLGGEHSGDVLLEPGMLVNEAFLKLADLNEIGLARPCALPGHGGADHAASAD